MDISNTINLNGQVWEKEDGAWIYKAEKSEFKKQDGTLKKKYADMPRYDLIPKYEDHFVKEFNSMLKDTQKELVSEMQKMIK